MTEKEFFKKVSNGSVDVIKQFLALLDSAEAEYCVIGGLAVNAYVEPVVSLDLDVVIASDRIDSILKAAKNVFETQEFPNSLNLKSTGSDLRIQIQKDPRYQPFLKRAEPKTVMGYAMRVACMEDVLQGKIWAHSDETRRKSKAQKDLADIYRLVEKYPHLKNNLPDSIK